MPGTEWCRLMKRPKDNLFKLINALSPAEKRYFKRHFAPETGNVTKLFDFINAMDRYDEHVIKNHFKDSKINANFKVYKVQLSDLLLKSLCCHYLKGNIRSKIRIGIEEIEILMDKELHQLAHQRLIKIKKVCKKFECFNYLQAIYDLECQFDINENLIKEINTFHKLQNSINQLKQVNFVISNFKNNPFSKNSAYPHQDIYDQFKVKYREVKTYSFQEQYYINNISAYFSETIENNLKKAYHFKNENFQLFKNRAEFILIFPEKYFAAYFNYIKICKQLKEFDTFKKGVQDLKEFCNVNKGCSQYKLHIYAIEINYYAQFGQQDYVICYLEDAFLDCVQEYQGVDKIQIVYIYIQFCIIYLIKNQFEKVQFYLRRLHELSKQLEEHFSHFFDTIEIILHYESNDTYILQKQINSLQRKLKRNNNKSDFLNNLLKFIAEISKLKIEERQSFAGKNPINMGLNKMDNFYQLAYPVLIKDWYNSILNKKSLSREIKDRNQDKSTQSQLKERGLEG